MELLIRQSWYSFHQRYFRVCVVVFAVVFLFSLFFTNSFPKLSSFKSQAISPKKVISRHSKQKQYTVYSTLFSTYSKTTLLHWKVFPISKKKEFYIFCTDAHGISQAYHLIYYLFVSFVLNNAFVRLCSCTLYCE